MTYRSPFAWSNVTPIGEERLYADREDDAVVVVDDVWVAVAVEVELVEVDFPPESVRAKTPPTTTRRTIATAPRSAERPIPLRRFNLETVSSFLAPGYKRGAPVGFRVFCTDERRSASSANLMCVQDCVVTARPVSNGLVIVATAIWFTAAVALVV